MSIIYVVFMTAVILALLIFFGLRSRYAANLVRRGRHDGTRSSPGGSAREVDFITITADSASDEIEGVVNGPRWLDAPPHPPAGLIPQNETQRPAQLPANGNQAQTLIEGAT